MFPWIERTFRGDPTLGATLERLKYEHCEDECFAEELTEMLERLGAADQTVNAETAGYMLRGFFTSLRRHVGFEREFAEQAEAERVDRRDLDVDQTFAQPRPG